MLPQRSSHGVVQVERATGVSQVQLGSVIQTGRKEGMQSIDESILNLARNGVISPEDAAPHLSNRELLGSMLKTNPAPAPSTKIAA